MRQADRTTGTKGVTDSAARKAYFKEGERITREYYLADPSNPYRPVGKTDGAQHWRLRAAALPRP